MIPSVFQPALAAGAPSTSAQILGLPEQSIGTIGVNAAEGGSKTVMQPKKTFKIASIQMNCGGNKEANIRHARELITSAKGADIVVLPEVWNVGYFSFTSYVAGSESAEGESVQMVRESAIEIGAYILAGSIIERSGNSFYNTSYFINPKGKIVGRYRKIHLFGYGSKESEILKRGRRVAVIPTELGTFGISTCYDLRFPELYRKMIDKGAEIFLITSAWPFARLEHWLLFNKARAVENLSFLVSANAVGANEGVELGGNSMIINPWGQVLAQGNDQEGIVRSEIDLGEMRKIRETFPALKDRKLK